MRNTKQGQDREYECQIKRVAEIIKKVTGTPFYNAEKMARKAVVR
jgi:hypothetical protein